MLLAECCPSMHKALGCIPSPTLTNDGGAYLKSSMGEGGIEAGQSEVQGYPQLQSKLEAGLDSIPYL